MDERTRELARRVWEYHHMRQELEPAECLLVMGSHDVRVAEWGARLFLEGYAPWIVFSGALGNLTEGVWTEAEAVKFARIAEGMGVPRERMLIEDRSTNTGENVRFTRRMLEERGFEFESFLVVQKPYMERRAFATFRKVWPEKRVRVTSPPLAYEEYPNGEISEEDVVHIMTGDLQRIRVYGERGFQIEQEMPEEVWEAFEELVRRGYRRNLIPVE